MVNNISTTARHAQLNVDSKPTNKLSQQAVTDIAPIAVETGQSVSVSGVAEEIELPAGKAKKVTDSLNKMLETTSTKLRYQYHEKLDKYYVTLVDSQTDEVVREIPNKKLMDIYAAMLDFVGVFVDEKI